MFHLHNLKFTGRDGDEFSIVEFTSLDLPKILEIEKNASAHPWSERNFCDALENSHICVGVKLHEQWCAHAVFSIAAGEAELLILAVEPKFQGQKIAKNLLLHVESQFKSRVSSIFLEVRISNHGAIGLYESLGFNQVGERMNYYPAAKGRESALIYAKHIDDVGFFSTQ